MSAKYGLVSYNSSRKHISISIPSTTEVMSPHIKSVEELRVLGINLSSFSAPSQFFICVAGVFLFYLIYGYLQELIFSVEGFKPFGWYLTLIQFGFYSMFGLVELQLTQDKRRRIPGKTYMIIAFLTVGTMGLSNTSLGYLNYPTQVIFKCCKLIPVMIGGVFIQGKRYNVADVSAAICMSLGLIWFTLADSKVAPNFNVTGVLLISLALCADAAIGNVQEKAMKLHNGSNSEMVLYSYSIGFVYILTGLLCVGGLGTAVAFCSEHPVKTYGYAFFFSLTGYFGISFVLALIKLFGALVAVTGFVGQGYEITREYHSFHMQCNKAPHGKVLSDQIRNQIVTLHKDWRGYKGIRRLLSITQVQQWLGDIGRAILPKAEHSEAVLKKLHHTQFTVYITLH